MIKKQPSESANVKNQPSENTCNEEELPSVNTASQEQGYGNPLFFGYILLLELI